MNKAYVSAAYINEKARPIRALLELVDTAEDNNITNDIAESVGRDIVFSFAVIAKELGMQAELAKFMYEV